MFSVPARLVSLRCGEGSSRWPAGSWCQELPPCADGALAALAAVLPDHSVAGPAARRHSSHMTSLPGPSSSSRVSQPGVAGGAEAEHGQRQPVDHWCNLLV